MIIAYICKYQVVSSGFMLQTIPSITNGIDIIPTIPKMIKKDDSETAGLLIIHGKGNEMTNQIIASKRYIFVFLDKFNIRFTTIVY